MSKVKRRDKQGVTSPKDVSVYMDAVNKDKLAKDQDNGAVSKFSDLTTSANHKQYLQLVHTTSISDDEHELYHDDDHSYDNLSSPVSPGFEDSASAGDAIPLSTDPVERERQIKEWTEELEKVEGEITMLRQVLGSKVRRATELKRHLGITPFKEFKHDLQEGINHIKESTTYQKTSAVVKTASEKTTSAISTVGAAMSKKLGDIKNSPTFKSMEEKVATSYASVKSKVTGSKSSEDIDAAFKEATEDEDAGSPTSESSDLPTEKVPL